MHGAARHLLALVRSLPSVLAHMNDKVVFPGKRLGTVLTAVRGLSRVLPHVNHQVLFSREYFRAVAARVLPNIAQGNLIKAALQYIVPVENTWHCIALKRRVFFSFCLQFKFTVLKRFSQCKLRLRY